MGKNVVVLEKNGVFVHENCRHAPVPNPPQDMADRGSPLRGEAVMVYQHPGQLHCTDCGATVEQPK